MEKQKAPHGSALWYFLRRILGWVMAGAVIIIVIGLVLSSNDDEQTDNPEEGIGEQEINDNFLENFTCDLLADLATFNSKQQYPTLPIVRITDISKTTDTPEIRECEGWAELSNGSYVIVELWARKTLDEGIEYGYETR